MKRFTRQLQLNKENVKLHSEFASKPVHSKSSTFLLQPGKFGKSIRERALQPR